MSRYPSAVRVDFVFGSEPGYVFSFFTPAFRKGFSRILFPVFTIG